MCYHNYTQHNGCGHIGECHNEPYTLCDDAKERLQALRGPMSPPLSPPPTANFAPPKRTSSTRRFFSLGSTLSRSSTSASRSSRRTVSGPPGNLSRASSSSYMSAGAGSGSVYGLPEHQLRAVLCRDPTKRTQVSSEMEVCKECAKWIREMRFLVERYDKTGSVRGTSAFEQFLKGRADGATGVGDQIGDVTVRLGDVARQAVIMGHPER